MNGVRRGADALCLGRDIGTGKVAAVLVDKAGRVRAALSRAHRADRPAPRGRAEQDLAALLRASIAAVRGLPARLRRQVCAVGVTGQMHGVALLDRRGRPLTPLATWQDGRCLEDPGFLPALYRRAGRRLRSGYGGATLAWHCAHGLPPKAWGAATAPDWIVMQLCGAAQPVMEASMAHSWGLFDIRRRRWDVRAVRRAGIPSQWLPAIVEWGGRAGTISRTAAAAWGLPAGRPVMVAIGDNQASVLATVDDPAGDIAVTIGTGAQASVIVPRSSRGATTGPAWEQRPFAPGCTLIVAASVNGGAAWAWLADVLRGWCPQIGGQPPSLREIFRRLDAAGLRARREIAVDPLWWPERHTPGQTGAVRGWTAADRDVGALARGAARGMARNLRSMLPEFALAGRRRIVGSGNALRRNPLLRRMIAAEFGCQLVMPASSEETAVGAALLAIRAMCKR